MIKNVWGKARKVWVVLLCLALFGGIFSPMGGVPKAAAKPKLSKTKLSLTVGKSTSLKVKGIAAGKIKKITYVSSNKSIVKVSKKGKVTALKKGTTKITVKVQLKNKKRYTLKCKVSVKDITIVPVPTTSPDSDTDQSEEQKPDVEKPTQQPATEQPTQQPDDNMGTDDVISDDKSPDASGKVTNAAFQMLHNMGIGINLGNTMESVGTWINPTKVSNFETAWGSPIITKAMISGMHKAGFETIRVPVAWSNMMSKDGNYTIDQAYFNRVDEIIGWALEEGMYVVLNDHFDGGWWGQFGSVKYQAEAWKRYEAIWTQVADHYKDYSNYLIFESANEELGRRLNDALDAQGNANDNGTKGTLTEDQCYETTNKINQKFIDIVRASGGKNDKRFLLIAGYDTDITRTCDSRFQMPKDTIADHLMISIHCYSPATYCLVEDPNNSWGFTDTWGTEEDKKTLQTELRQMKLNFSDKGIPVIIGEYGVADVKVNGVDTRKKNRNLYFEEVCKYAIDAGMCPVLWDITNHVYHRENAKMIYEDEAQSFLLLAKQSKEKEPYRYSEKDITEYIWEGTVGCEGWNPTNISAEDSSNFFMTSLGGCYKISGIDWDNLKKPVLKLHSDTLSVSTGYYIGIKTSGNEYWQYIDDADVLFKGNWNMGSDLNIDLSSLGLREAQSLYISLKGETDFSGKIRMTIKDK